MPITRAGIIARVSTTAQLDNTSPEEQLRRGREYCERQRYHVVIERTEAISGTFVLARSVLNEYLTMAADGKLDVIVFDIPDRAGRGDAIAKVELLAQMNGARVEYSAPGRDVTTPEGFIHKSAEQMVSGIERMNIRRRTMGGRRAKATEGRFIATSYRTFGYNIITRRNERGRIESCHLEVREDEAAIVGRIFSMCVDENLSTYAIAQRLTLEGVPTQKETGQILNRKYPGLWHKSTIHGILTNTSYMGQWRYGKRKVEMLDTPGKIRKRTTTRDESDVITVAVPPIVSQTLWVAAQKILGERRERGHKPTRWNYLLRGRIRCAQCGGLYHGTTKARAKGPEQYYRCGKSMGEYIGYQCKARSLNVAKVDAEVWDKIIEQLQDESALFEKITANQEDHEKARRTLQATIAALEIQNQRASGKIERYLELYGDGGLDKAEYLSKRQAVEGEIERRNLERGDLESQLGNYPVLSPEVDLELRKLRADVLLASTEATHEERVRLLDILGIECHYNDETGEMTITGALGVHVLSVTSTFEGRYEMPFFFVLPVREPREVCHA